MSNSRPQPSKSSRSVIARFAFALTLLTLCNLQVAFALDPKFRFCGPINLEWYVFHNQNGVDPELWTLQKSNLLEQELVAIQAEHSQFFANASASCDSVDLVSCKLNPAVDPVQIDDYLNAYSSHIEIDDRYFSSIFKYRKRTMLHALAHLLDTGGCMSTSPEFVRVALPVMNKLDKLYESQPLTPYSVSGRNYGDRFVQKRGLASLDCLSSLSECFAESVTAYLCGDKKYVAPEFRAFIEKYVTGANSEFLKRRKLFTEAELAVEHWHFEHALRATNVLIAEYPEMLDVHAMRAEVWCYKKDFEMMEYELNLEMALLERRRIPKSHCTWTRVENLLAAAKAKRGYYYVDVQYEDPDPVLAQR